MDKNVFIEKLFAYVKTSINDVTRMSPEDQARWVEEVKKYYPSDYDPANLKWCPEDQDGQLLWLKKIEYLTPSHGINPILLKLPSVGFEFVPSIILNCCVEMYLICDKNEVSDCNSTIQSIIKKYNETISIEQVYAHLFNILNSNKPNFLTIK